MIKFIHTADWHIGLTSWQKIDRNLEIIQALNQLYEFSKNNEVDFIIIAGDLFDKISPTYNDIEIIYKFINKFANFMPVYIILGNHDWRGLSFLNYFSNTTNIHITSSLAKFKYKDYVNLYAFSYLNLKKLLYNINQEQLHQKANEIINNYILNNINKNIDKEKINIFIYHGSVQGALYTDEISKFSEYFLPKDLFPDVDYIALGHIHTQQQINHSIPAYYSGSLIKSNFSMVNSKIGALYVQLDNKGNINIENIKLNYKKLQIIKLNKDNYENIKNIINNTKADYIKIEIEQMPENINFSELKNELYSFNEKIVKIQLKNIKKLNIVNNLQDYKEIKNKSIKELFSLYLKQLNNDNKEIIQLFNDYFKRAEDELNSITKN